MLKELKKRMERDERTRAYLNPVRIVWENDGVQNSAAFLRDQSRQISLHGDSLCTLSPGGALVLDFGQEICGGLEFSVQQIIGGEDARLRIRFGESVTEVMSELGGATNATNDHARRDFTMTVRYLSMNPVGETGFRFVRIDLLSENVSLSIKTAKAVMLYRDIPYLGSFECDDELLNRIWNVGAYTVHLNMQQYIWDGIKRDRLVWIGDLHPEIATIQTVFGDQKIIRDSLDYVVAETPAGQWMNDIPSYSMWWVIIQYEYFLQFGDREYLAKQLPCLKQICNMLSDHIGADGLDSTPDMRFVDWPTKGSAADVNLGLQSLHVLANDCAKEVFKQFGDMEMAEQCAADAEKLRRWPVQVVSAKQSNALAVWAGLLDAATANEENLKTGGAQGLSTFMAYYILSARAQAGDVSGALDAVREYYGGMLKLGATTFWEDFDVRWLENAAPIDRLPEDGEIDMHGTYGNHCYEGFRHSLCHGWSSAVTAWLTKCILGIEIVESGCRKIRVNPRLCGLKWARGSYPTPLGVLEVEHRVCEDGSIETKIKAPTGVEIIHE